MKDYINLENFDTYILIHGMNVKVFDDHRSAKVLVSSCIQFFWRKNHTHLPQMGIVHEGHMHGQVWVERSQLLMVLK